MYKYLSIILILYSLSYADISYQFYAGEFLPAHISAGRISFYTAHEVSVIASNNIRFSNFELIEANLLDDFAIVTINSTELHVIGEALPYPNPSDPFRDNTFIGYSLNKPADITLQIYNLRRQKVKEIFCVSGENGGKEGYNKVEIGPYTDWNSFYSNGLYLFFVIKKDENRLLYKGKVTVLR